MKSKERKERKKERKKENLEATLYRRRKGRRRIGGKYLRSS